MWFMQFVRSISLNIKLNTLVILVFVILVLVLGSLAGTNVQRLVLDYGQIQLGEEARLLQQHFADQEQEVISSVRFLTNAAGIVDAVNTEDIRQIRTTLLLQAESLDLNDIHVVNSDGETVLNLSQADLAHNEETESALIALGLLGIESSELIVEEEANLGLLASISPLKNASGVIVGAIFGARSIDTAFMAELNFEREETHIAFIYNNEVIATDITDEGELLEFDEDQDLIAQAERGSLSISEELSFDENETPDLVAYMPLQVAGQDRAVLAISREFEPLFVFQRQLVSGIRIASLAVASVAVVGLLLFVYLSVIRPITQLTRVAEQIAGGNLQQRVPEGSQDEIGKLGRTFNLMAGQVGQRIVEAESAREHAERSDQVKSAFLASMSHELRTPLNSVINFTKFVVRGVMGPVTDRQEETLNRVIASAQHLLSLINDVLDMSKIESGSLNLFIEDDVDLNEIIDSVAAVGEGILAEKQVKLQRDIPERLPILQADRKRITQIILNIMSNACKFTDEGFVKISASATDHDVTITVQDTGPGIAPEDYGAIFEPFQQTHSGLRQGEGTGLGMPITKSLVEAHKGKLWFESEPGSGSTFYVRLPIVTQILETIPA